MGDRIAILDVGGVLEQYDTPAEILGRPASAMVADFVGADRGLKRLRVTPIDLEHLEHPPTVGPDATLAEVRAVLHDKGLTWVAVVDDAGTLLGSVHEDDAAGDAVARDRLRRIEAWVPQHGSLQDALAMTLLTKSGWVAVLDGDCFLGVITPEAVYRSLRAVARGRRRRLTGYAARRAALERDRAGGTGVRTAGAAAVRRRSPQDDRDAARRRVTAHLRHRGRVRGRRPALRFDDRRAQARRPHARSPLRAPRPDVPPRGGQGGRLVGRGQDRRTSDPGRSGGHG